MSALANTSNNTAVLTTMADTLEAAFCNALPATAPPSARSATPRQSVQPAVPVHEDIAPEVARD